jgi:pimeloyl-ACP methyl ester carboxylesterase
MTSFYRPTRHASRVRCPVLLVMANHDEVMPSWSVQKELARPPDGQLVTLNCSHFDPYEGPCFENAVVAEQRFLTTHLKSK